MIRLFTILMLSFLPLSAEAEEHAVIKVVEPTDITVELYPVSERTEDSTIYISPDKSELISLPEKVTTVIAGNPNHVTILPSSSDGLVLIGKAPGATHFTALNENGDVIMQRHIVVAGPKQNYVRIRKTCVGAGDGCQSTSVYYCPDTCHEIILNTENGGGSGDGGFEGGLQTSSQAMTGGMVPPAPIDSAQE